MLGKLAHIPLRPLGSVIKTSHTSCVCVYVYVYVLWRSEIFTQHLHTSAYDCLCPALFLLHCLPSLHLCAISHLTRVSLVLAKVVLHRWLAHWRPPFKQAKGRRDQTLPQDDDEEEQEQEEQEEKGQTQQLAANLEAGGSHLFLSLSALLSPPLPPPSVASRPWVPNVHNRAERSKDGRTLECLRGFEYGHQRTMPAHAVSTQAPLARDVKVLRGEGVSEGARWVKG